MEPTVNLTITVKNPNWVPVYDANGITSNMDEYHAVLEFDVEVLTVHFQRNSMRVRFTHMGKVETRDVDATPFFEKYKVVEV
jgi:hypothetical protein